MKKFILGSAFALFFSAPALAQIPVTDGASIAQQIAQQVETIAKWKIQYDQMKAQIEQAEKQFESMTGSRNLGQILNDPKFRNTLPQDWQAAYDNIKDSGVKGLAGRGKDIYEQNKVFDSCAFIKEEQEKLNCEAMAVKPSQDKAFALDAYDKAKDRITQIEQLMAKINDTPDQKAIAELQGRIAAEQATLQNEQTRIQLYQMIVASEEKIQQQRGREIQSKHWNNAKGTTAKPVTFN